MNSIFIAGNKERRLFFGKKRKFYNQSKKKPPTTPYYKVDVHVTTGSRNFNHSYYKSKQRKRK